MNFCAGRGDRAEKNAHAADFERVDEPHPRILRPQINKGDAGVDDDVQIEHHQSEHQKPCHDALARAEQVDHAAVGEYKVNQQDDRHHGNDDVKGHGPADFEFLFLCFQVHRPLGYGINTIIQLPIPFCNYKLVTIPRRHPAHRTDRILFLSIVFPADL